VSKHDREKKTERVWLRVGPSLKALLEERAQSDRRELAEWIRLRLERMVERPRRAPRDGRASRPI
jgi:predicted HicB family RNase H-like nuclease